MPALLALALLQGSSLVVTQEVERARVAVGEEVVFTLHAVGHSTAAFRVELPPFDGFAITDRRERTDVVPSGREITRAFTLELHLRAEQVGTWAIGAIRVEQGDLSAFSGPETVTVVNASGGAPAGLDPDLLALIPRVPSPATGSPSLYVVPSADAVFAGDQVNILTAAWLPRGLRLRLRQPPTLSPPALPGVWSTPRTSVPGAVASRTVDGEIYDLFVGFQTVFPLNPGAVTIPPARLTWMEPAGRQFSPDDRRQVVTSAPASLLVRPLPDAGKPAGFGGPTARDLRIEYRLDQGAGRAGAVLPVEIVVSGAGNLTLWPSPAAAWPAGARVYEEGTESSSRMAGQRLGGSRRFLYTVVPDSAGSLSLPSIEYPYFDPASGTYRISRAPGIVVPVLDAAPASDQRSPLPLEERGAPPAANQLLALPGAALALLIAAPFLLVALLVLLGRRRPPVAQPAPAADPAARLDALVRTLVPPSTEPSERDLSAALRNAGLDRDRARRLVELHLALERERFGPAGDGRPGPALLRDIAAALEQVPPRLRRASGWAAVGALVLSSLFAPPLPAQSGITLYRERQYAAAAAAFRAEGRSPAQWYNVAAAEFMARRDAQAVAALLAARARAPRDPHVETLWKALSRQHEQLRRAGSRLPVSAEECLAAAVVLLWVGAFLFVVFRRRFVPATVPWLLALALGGTGLVLRQQREVPRAVLSGGASLRISPHGLAPERGTVAAFSVVRLERKIGSWWLVEAPGGGEGWIPEDVLALTPR